MTHEDLEQAIKDGKTVQICTINQYGEAVEWHNIDKIRPIYDISRFRIVDADKIKDSI